MPKVGNPLFEGNGHTHKNSCCLPGHFFPKECHGKMILEEDHSCRNDSPLAGAGHWKVENRPTTGCHED